MEEEKKDAKSKNIFNILIQNNKINKKFAIILSSIVVIIITILIIFILYIYPKLCINNINTNYNTQKYSKVEKYDSKLDMLEKYLKNDNNQYLEIEYKVKMSQALIFLDKRDFSSALKVLLEINLSNEEVKNKINDCKYELGKKCIKDTNYSDALKYLNQVTNREDINDLLDKCNYNLALKYLDDKKYVQAIEAIGKVKNKEYENLDKTKKQIHYEYGKYSFNNEDYNAAISQFENIKDYEDTNTYLNNAYIAKAEKLIKENRIADAKNIYDYIPEETEYNGIKASDRKKQLNKYQSIINTVGKKTATKSYCESRNVWKYDGRWENWYLDTVDSSEYIDTSLTLNDDGTLSLKGIVYFYAFDNFSSLQQYCTAKIVSRRIELNNINYIPSTFDIDEHTKLLYSNGTFSIKYNKRDNYSTSFYNIYSSNVTY